MTGHMHIHPDSEQSFSSCNFQWQKAIAAHNASEDEIIATKF